MSKEIPLYQQQQNEELNSNFQKMESNLQQIVKHWKVIHDMTKKTWLDAEEVAEKTSLMGDAIFASNMKKIYDMAYIEYNQALKNLDACIVSINYINNISTKPDVTLSASPSRKDN